MKLVSGLLSLQRSSECKPQWTTVVNSTNRFWDLLDNFTLASRVLWTLNHIHPFINGNGRTARVACYYVLCLRSGGLIPGAPTLPELRKINHADYVARLRLVDQSYNNGSIDYAPLNDLLIELVSQQLETASK